MDVTNNPEVVYPMLKKAIEKGLMKRVLPEYLSSLTETQRDEIGALLVVHSRGLN